jgi:hypothetical protein
MRFFFFALSEKALEVCVTFVNSSATSWEVRLKRKKEFFLLFFCGCAKCAVDKRKATANTDLFKKTFFQLRRKKGTKHAPKTKKRETQMKVKYLFDATFPFSKFVTRPLFFLTINQRHSRPCLDFKRPT